MRKSLTTTLLSLFLLLGVTGKLSSQLTFSIDPVTTNQTQGASFCLDVTVQGFTNIVSVQYSINYDASLLSYTGSQGYNLPNLGASNIANPNPGDITLSWLSDDLTNGSTVADGTSIFQICFDVTAANGTSDVAFSGTPVPVEISDAAGNIITPTFNNGTVVIGNGGGGGNTGLTFALPNVSANQGDNVCLDVTVAGFTDIVSMQYSINYDASLLTYTGSQGYNLPNFGASNIGNPNPGDLTISWLSDDVVNGSTVADGTIIFQICFDVTGSGGVADVSFSGTPSPVEVSDAGGNIVTPTFNNGSVTVSSGGGSGTDLTFTLPNITANQGDNVCLDVTVENFTDIVSMQYSINYDASLLTYTGSQGYNLPNFGASNIGNPSAGNLTISWVSDDVVNGTTVADGTSIFQICFDVTGSSGVAGVSFSGSPSIVEISDANGNLVTPVFNTGSVTIDGGGGGSTTDLTFTLPNITANQGDNVCLDVTVENFTDIVSMQYSINYDASLLTYTGSQGYNLPNFGASNIGNPSAGNLTISWVSDDVVNGTTVADGTSIFQICFDVTGSSGVADVGFSGSPSIVEISDANGNLVTPVFNDGSVAIGGGGGSTTDLTFTLPDMTANQGDNVCLDVTVENFTDIVSMQYSINYDASLLTYTGSQGYNLPNFGASNIGNPSAGNLTISWVSDDVVNGTTVADGTSIFQICFDVTGSSGVADVGFSGSPSIVEISDANGNLVTPVFNDGSVTIGGGGPGGFVLFLSNESGTSGSNVCLEITTQDFTNIVSMQFSINYDAALLSYTGSQGYNLPNFGASNIGNPNPGNITVSWLSDDVINGTTVADGTSIFQICFDLTGPNNCSSVTPVVFSGSPVAIEISDASGNLINFTGVDGSVLICDTPPAEITFFAGDEEGSPGNVVCVPVTAVGFTNITSFQYSMTYDPSILQFQGALPLSLPDFTSSVYANPSAGVLTFAWVALSDPVNGVTLPDTAQLFEICFTVTGNPGDVSPIIFTGSPTSIEVNNTTGIVNPSFDNGSVTVVDIPCFPLNVSEAITQPCPGTSSGAIDLTVSGGDNLSYSYTWSNGATTEDISNLPAGTYSVTITSCTEAFTASYDVTDLPTIDITVVAVQDVACFGEATGSIDISVQGASPFTYSWAGTSAVPNASDEDPSGLVSGTYWTTVTDANGCELVSDPIAVAQPTAPLNATIGDVQGVECFGDQTGSISLNVNGGTAPYDYTWSPSLPNTPNPTGLAAGTYDVTVTDANGCTVFGNDIEVSTPPLLEIILDDVQNETAAGNDGAIFVSVTGGIGGYNYTWTGPGGPYVTQDIVNLVAGDYTLVVEDANGCTASISVTLIKPLTIDVDEVIPSCYGAFDGAISVTISGGQEPYQLSWDGPGGPYSDEDLSGLGGGVYTLTVVDAGGDETSVSVMVFEPSEAFEIVSASANGVSASGVCDGSIAILELQGGVPPYDYSWNGGTYTGPSLNSLCVGAYEVVITDANGCTVSGSYEVLPAPLIVDQDLAVDVLCAGDSTGSWTVAVEGGIPPYNFVFDNGFSTLSIDGEVALMDLPAGNYCVTVSDSYTPSQEVILCNVVEEPEPLGFASAPEIYPQTSAGNNGAIQISMEGGTLPYNFQWSNNFSGQNPSNLSAGCYVVTVEDAHGCVFVSDEICVPLFELTAVDVTDAICAGDEEGMIELTVGGGINEPLTYVWMDEEGNVLPFDDNIANGLAAGTYAVVITDALGVEMPPQQIEVGYESNVQVEGTATSNYNGYNVSCSGDENGTAVATASGGVAPYSFSWCAGNGQGAQADNLPEGQVCIVVTDALGCVDTGYVELTAPTPILLNPQVTPVSCVGKGDGSIVLHITGGAPEYTFTWSANVGQNTNPVILLEGGSYGVTVTDGNGCSVASEIEVPEPDTLRVSMMISDDDGTGTGAVTALVTGGWEPYEYIWSNGEFGASFIDNLNSGEYVVEVTDSLGCTAYGKAFVSDLSIDCLEYREIITPEGDGKNERLVINCLLQYLRNHLSIYNRWGQLVYETDNYQNDWEGTTSSGAEVPEGAYFFILEYVDVDGTTKQMKGHVTVLR